MSECQDISKKQLPQLPTEIIKKVLSYALDPTNYGDTYQPCNMFPRRVHTCCQHIAELDKTTYRLAASSKLFFRIVHDTTKDHLAQAWVDDKEAWVRFILTDPHESSWSFVVQALDHSHEDKADSTCLRARIGACGSCKIDGKAEQPKCPKHPLTESTEDEDQGDAWKAFRDDTLPGINGHSPEYNNMRVGFVKVYEKGMPLGGWRQFHEIAEQRLEVLKLVNRRLDVAAWCFDI